MFDLTLVEELGLIAITAAIAALLSRPLRVPTIVAYLLTGLPLGLRVRAAGNGT
jgi:Kef-type K+ transport system membrane component KefB